MATVKRSHTESTENINDDDEDEYEHDFDDYYDVDDNDDVCLQSKLYISLHQRSQHS